MSSPVYRTYNRDTDKKKIRENHRLLTLRILVYHIYKETSIGRLAASCGSGGPRDGFPLIILHLRASHNAEELGTFSALLILILSRVASCFIIQSHSEQYLNILMLDNVLSSSYIQSCSHNSYKTYLILHLHHVARQLHHVLYSHPKLQ